MNKQENAVVNPEEALARFEASEASFRTHNDGSGRKPSKPQDQESTKAPEGNPLPDEIEVGHLKEDSKTEEETSQTSDEGKEEEQTVDWEKRFKDSQSFGTKKAQEAAQKEKEIQRYKRLVDRFKHRIEFDENGLPVDWNFEDDSKASGGKKSPPSPPSEKDWIDNPAEAAEKFYEFKESLRKEQEAKDRESNDYQAMIESKQAAWQKNLEESTKLYPQAADESSELFQRVVQILEFDDPELRMISKGISIAIKQAANELGIKPVVKSGGEKKTASASSKDRTYITNIKSGGAPPAKSSSDNLDERYLKFEEEESKFRTAGGATF